MLRFFKLNEPLAAIDNNQGLGAGQPPLTPKPSKSRNVNPPRAPITPRGYYL